MISVSINGLTVSGSNADEFEFALANVARVAQIAAENNAVQAPIQAVKAASQVTEKGKSEMVKQWCAENGKSRFRRTQDEIDAGMTDEQAAANRLGVSMEKGTAEKGEAVSGLEIDLDDAASGDEESEETESER